MVNSTAVFSAQSRQFDVPGFRVGILSVEERGMSDRTHQDATAFIGDPIASADAARVSWWSTSIR